MIFDNFKKIVLEKKQKPQKKPFLIARAFEENKILQILNRQNKNNCIVIGNNGVGKSSLLKSVKEKINPDILIVDDVHLMDKEKSLELKLAIIKKDVQCLISTSLSAYKSYKDIDGFFANNFMPVLLLEPNNTDLLEIIKIKAKELEIYHNLYINPIVFQKLIDLTKRYVQNAYMPASVLDCLDGICANKRIKYAEIPQEIEYLSKSISELKSQNLGLAGQIELKALGAKYDKLFYDWQEDKSKKHAINIYDIYDYFAQLTSLDVLKIKNSFEDKINLLENNLNKRILGQERAIKEVCATIKNWSFNKPLVLCFEGRRGVGKYKVCKEIADLLYDDYQNLVAGSGKDYQIIITDDVSLATNKNLNNSILVYKENNDFVDTVIAFDDLGKKEAREIAKKQLFELEDSFKNKNISFEVEEQAYMFLVSKGYSKDSGVENMRSVINAEVLAKLDALMSAQKIENCKIFIYFQSGALELKVKT